MRPVKVFGLTAIAAVAALALIGASSATAMNTALCSTNNGGLLTCPIEKQVTSFHSVALNSTFLTTAGNVVCKEALAEGSVLGLAAPQISHLTKFNWTGCTSPFGACTVTTIKLGLILFLKTAVNLGSLVYDNLVFKISCGAFINCEYTPVGENHLLGSTLPLAGGGGSNGGFNGTKAILSPAGLLDAPCPEASWDYFYESLTPLWVKT